jgi:chemotaxis protein methyltransferase CheR
MDKRARGHQAAAVEGEASSTLAAARPPLADARRGLLQRLSLDVERIAGIEITGPIQSKLARVLGSIDLAELEAWIARLHLLPARDPEWLSLIESLTVHETYFYRDRAQLDFLGSEILPEIIVAAAASGRYRLRMWSAGCATGEEAYTLAVLGLLALCDAGYAEERADRGIECRPPWTLEVLGTEISRLVLVQARAAVYPMTGRGGAFRDLPRRLDRFFPPLPRAEEKPDIELRGVHPAVRRHISFEQFNLMARLPPATGFDVVLCRNVLIYLSAAARRHVHGVLKQALRPGGFLLLGPTDVPAEPALFTTCWGNGAAAYVLKLAHA